MKTDKLSKDLGEVNVSRALVEDLPNVLRLWLEAAEWLSNKGIYQWKPNSFTHDTVQEHFQRTELYVAKLNDVVIGSFSIQWSDEFIWQDRNDDNSGYIHRLVIGREFKGRSLGINLLATAEEYIKLAGKKSAKLDCMADNERLNNFYLDAGYNFISRIDRKYWSASLFEKILT